LKFSRRSTSHRTIQRSWTRQALEVLSLVEDISHHGTFILHGFEDPFLQKKSVKDDSSILRVYMTYYQHVGATCFVRYAKSHPTRTLKDLLHGSKPMNYESMMYVYGWMME